MQDIDIIELFFKRDEKALEETAEKYGRSLLRLSENITKNELDAEECVNDTYLVAWNSIPPERPAHFFAWLARITRNNSCNIIQAKERQKRVPEILELTDELGECLCSDSNILTELKAEKLNKVLDSFVRGLDRNTQFVFVQRYFFSEALGSISKSTGFSESKIKSMLYRARKKLKNILEKEGFNV